MAFKHFVSIILILSVLLKATIIDAQNPQNPAVDKKEEHFLNKMKDYWRKTFGNVEMPPSIKASTCNQPPPREVMDALMELAAVEDNKSPEKEKSEAMAEKAVEKEAPNKKLKPQVEDRLAQMLAKILQGPNADHESVSDTKALIEEIMSGSDAFVDLNAVQNKLDDMEKKRLKEAIASSMSRGGQAKLKRGKLGAAMKATGVGYGGDHATSTILAVSKCTGQPNVDNLVHDKSVESLFFVAPPQGEVSPGQKMKLQFNKGTNNGAFMESLQEDSSGVMSAILLMDLVTMLGKIMDKKQTPDITAEMDTVLMCEETDGKNNGGEKSCAMDLEAMVSKTKAMIGQDIQPTATWITKDSPAPVGYTLTAVKKLPVMKTVGCNKMGFPFAVFYCKDLPKTVDYAVSLAGDDGSSLKSIVLCHEDTSKWNPKSWIFTTLKTKPGAAKICHFLAADDVAWLPKTPDTVVA
ncbi:hypothetical protein V2J09_005256 [Rumex salicifolius]